MRAWANSKPKQYLARQHIEVEKKMADILQTEFLNAFSRMTYNGVARPQLITSNQQ